MSDSRPQAVCLKKSNQVRNRLILLAAASLIGLMFAEFVFRIHICAKYRNAVGQYQSNQWVLLPGNPREYDFIPGITGTLEYLEDVSQYFSYHINDQGFRGRMIPCEMTAGIKHVLFIGDSYTFGWALNEREEIFSSVVEGLLNQDRETTSVLTFNAGIPGYNTVQELALLSKMSERYRFDHVVLGYVMNDAEPQITVPVAPRKQYGNCRFWVLERLKCIVNEVVLKEDFFELDVYKGTFEYNLGFESGSPKWKTSRTALKEIQKLCISTDTGLSVFILPDFSRSLDETYPYHSIHEKVSAWCDELDIDYVDLYPFFGGSGNTLFRVVGDGHPNAKAHRIIGGIMAKKLAAELFRAE